MTGHIISITSETATLFVLFLGVAAYAISPVIALVIGACVWMLLGVIPMAGAVDVV